MKILVLISIISFSGAVLTSFNNLVLFKEAVNEATVGETEVINDIDLLNKIKEIYRNKLIENDYSWSYINMQMKYKLIPSKMKSVLGRTLKGLGWKQSKYMGNRIWRR